MYHYNHKIMYKTNKKTVGVSDVFLTLDETYHIKISCMLAR